MLYLIRLQKHQEQLDLIQTGGVSKKQVLPSIKESFAFDVRNKTTVLKVKHFYFEESDAESVAAVLNQHHGEWGVFEVFPFIQQRTWLVESAL